MSNIYVGNLNYRLTDERLKQAFSAFGEVVSARVIKDRESGRSKGFGFVVMATQSDGDTAIARLHGQQLEGRTLKVTPAKTRHK